MTENTVSLPLLIRITNNSQLILGHQFFILVETRNKMFDIEKSIRITPKIKL